MTGPISAALHEMSGTKIMLTQFGFDVDRLHMETIRRLDLRDRSEWQQFEQLIDGDFMFFSSDGWSGLNHLRNG